MTESQYYSPERDLIFTAQDSVNTIAGVDVKFKILKERY